MAGWTSDALRNRKAGQERIKHYCSCGRMIVGNPGWASHKRANPEHRAVSQAHFGEKHCRHCGEVINKKDGVWAHVRGPGSVLIRCQPPAPYGTDAEPE